MRRIIAQARKELTQIVRDWRTLALALLLPLILLLLMSTALSLTASDLPIIVQDLDGSPASRDLWMPSAPPSPFASWRGQRTGSPNRLSRQTRRARL